ncbi:MAG: hypothetical protein ABWZ41_05505 [Burkholderiales bacterium]
MPRGFWLIVLFLIALAGAAWHFWDDLRPQLTSSSGPEITPIPSIVAAPVRYDGKEVTVTGVVNSTSDIRLASGAGSRSYTLKEGNVEIVVVPRDALPARGQSYTVTGKVSRPPGNQGLAPRLAETKRERTAR